MKRTSLMAVVFASALLGGCATYDYVGDTAPGGYYHGRPSVEYVGPYGGGYYGGGYYGYYDSPYRYRGYYGYPYYGYYGSHYPYYPPHRPRPPRPGDNDHKPPPSSGGGNRPPPWRDPTGRWREGGSQPMIPNRPNQVMPSPSQPRVGQGGYRPPRVTPTPSMPRSVERPRTMERSAPRMERPAAPATRTPRGDSATRQLER